MMSFLMKTAARYEEDFTDEEGGMPEFIPSRR